VRTGIAIGIVAVVLIASLAGAYWLGAFNDLRGGGGGGGGGGSNSSLAVNDSATPSGGSHPLVVSFESHVAGGTPPYTYLWHLGDGTTAATPTAQDTYTVRGTYSVGLMVTDARGRSQNASTLSIEVNPIINAAIIVNSTTESVGPGPAGALVIPFVVPTIGLTPNSVNDSINGYVNVTACASSCSNLKVFILIVTPAEARSIVDGGPVNEVWCYGPGAASCQPYQYAQINLNLDYYSGWTLDLLLYNTNPSQAQTAFVDVAVYSAV